MRTKASVVLLSEGGVGGSSGTMAGVFGLRPGFFFFGFSAWMYYSK